MTFDKAYCAPGAELSAAVELALAGETADVEPHPYLAGFQGVVLVDTERIAEMSIGPPFPSGLTAQ